MNELDLLDNRIERYVHKRMTDEERISFEEEMKTNDQLRKNIRDLITLVELYSVELLELKMKLDTTEEELKNEGFFKS